MASPSLILAGHEVHAGAAPPSSSEARVAVRLDDLLALVRKLRERGYRFTGLAEFLARRNQGGLALLTFDDACRSVHELAWPALRAEGVPFLIFVVAEALARDQDPFPLWLFALRDARRGFGALPEGLERHPLFARLMAPLTELLDAPLPVLVETFRNGFDQDELGEMGAYLARAAPALRQTLGPAALRAMLDGGGVELGAHSMTHRSFAHLGPAEIEQEIAGSLQAIAAFAARTPAEIAFAYPYGASTVRAQELVRRRCAAGFTCYNRAVSRLDPQASLPRINLDADCLRTLDRTLGANRSVAVLREKTRLHLRTGPAWRWLGPVWRRFGPRRAASGAGAASEAGHG